MWTRIYPPELRSVNLDFDWFWRRLLPVLGRKAATVGSGARSAADAAAAATVQGVRATVERTHGLDSRMAKTWPTGRMALSVLLLLLGYLVLYYL
jgi:multicomponent Na+:H+ antiporter subunit D